MSTTIIVSGIMESCGVYPGQEKLAIKLFLNKEESDKIQEVINGFLNYEPTAQHNLKDIDYAHFHMIDLPDIYIKQIRISEGKTPVVIIDALTKEKLDLKEVKWGSEVKVQVSFVSTNFAGQKRISSRMSHIGVLVAQKYKYSSETPDQLKEKEDAFNMAIADYVTNEVENIPF